MDRLIDRYVYTYISTYIYVCMYAYIYMYVSMRVCVCTVCTHLTSYEGSLTKYLITVCSLLFMGSPDLWMGLPDPGFN